MRDRFVSFAFAAAELLIETDKAGTIQFATGAFNRWFSLPAGELIGRSLGSLFSAADQGTAGLCLSLAGARGRVAPMTVHLANAEATPMALAGLCRPDMPQAICFTLGRVPSGRNAEPALLASQSLAEAMQTRVAQGADGSLGLIEIRGLAIPRQGTDRERQGYLRDELSSTLALAAGPDAQAQRLADGRYGLLAGSEQDIENVVGRLQALLNAIPEAANAHVRGSGVCFAAGNGLTKQQASSAMRYALGRFAEGGIDALPGAGFADGLNGFLTHANARARGAREAIRNGKFKLRFQPIVSLATGVIHHYEALLRTIPTEQNTGSDTQEFVSFVEAVGLAEELDLAVMGQALRAMRNAPWASVAINISGISAQSRSFRENSATMIRAAVAEHNLHPLIELTETVEICNVMEAAATLAELRAAGALTCLDDFGAGAASYRYLRDFSVDFVKIDGSFVRGAETNARAHGMILSIVELANFVGAKVIAEAVETKEQANLLLQGGVDLGQGWLFGRPGHLPGGPA